MWTRPQREEIDGALYCPDDAAPSGAHKKHKHIICRMMDSYRGAREPGLELGAVLRGLEEGGGVS